MLSEGLKKTKAPSIMKRNICGLWLFSYKADIYQGRAQRDENKSQKKWVEKETLPFNGRKLW